MRVARVLVRRGRAVGVRTERGRGDLGVAGGARGGEAPALFRDLVGEQHLPAGFVDDLRLVPVRQLDRQGRLVARRADPMDRADARRAGMIHVADGMDVLTVVRRSSRAA